MANVFNDAVQQAVTEWAKTAEGKKYVQEAMSDYISQGGKVYDVDGKKIATFSDMEFLSNELIKYLQNYGASYFLAEPSQRSIYNHFFNLNCTSPTKKNDNSYSVTVYFDDDISRPSLVPDYSDGAYNIIQLFNNGWLALNRVAGYWHGDYTVSRKEYEGRHFMERAIDEFNKIYGSKYNVKAMYFEDPNDEYYI